MATSPFCPRKTIMAGRGTMFLIAVNRHEERATRLIPAAGSLVTEQDEPLGGLQQIAGHAAEKPLAEARTTVAAGDD